MILGLFILAILGLTLAPLFYYFNSPDISKAYSNRYTMFYLVFPIIILSFFVNFFSKWADLKGQLRYAILLALMISLSLFVDWLLRSDANKVLITINNTSDKRIENIKVSARNDQNIEIGDLITGQKKSTYCDCRSVVSSDSTGIKLSFEIDGHSFHNYVVERYSPLYDQVLEVRILNDTLAYRSYEYGENEVLWGRLGKYSALNKWDDLK